MKLVEHLVNNMLVARAGEGELMMSTFLIIWVSPWSESGVGPVQCLNLDEQVRKM